MLAAVELRHLRYFVAVAEELHFTRAAQRLHVAQPALSQAVRQVERELGAPLLVRAPHGVSLTAAGGLMLEQSRAVLARYDAAIAAVRELTTGQAPPVRLGVPANLPPGVLVRLLATARDTEPETVLELRTEDTAHQLAALVAGELDLALVRQLPGDGTVLGHSLYTERLGLVTATGHPLAELEAVPAARLSGAPFVIFPRRMIPDVYDRIIGALTAAGGRPGSISESPDFPTTLEIVQKGLAVALALQSQVDAHPGRDQLRWRPLTDVDLDTVIHLAWRNPPAVGVGPLLTRVQQDWADGPA